MRGGGGGEEGSGVAWLSGSVVSAILSQGGDLTNATIVGRETLPEASLYSPPSTAVVLS